MTLGDFIVASGWSNTIFAKELAPLLGKKKVPRRTVESWRQGRAMPRGLALKAIAELTGNQVTYEDFVRNLRGK
jgi:uncharacterized membrane protein YbaN (DUF454 family)